MTNPQSLSDRVRNLFGYDHDVSSLPWPDQEKLLNELLKCVDALEHTILVGFDAGLNIAENELVRMPPKEFHKLMRLGSALTVQTNSLESLAKLVEEMEK